MWLSVETELASNTLELYTRGSAQYVTMDTFVLCIILYSDKGNLECVHIHYIGS